MKFKHHRTENPTMTRFPMRTKQRTVVYAGPVAVAKPEQKKKLKRYLKNTRSRDVYLLHHGQRDLEEVADTTGVTPIRVDTETKQPEPRAAVDMAVALDAQHLEFPIEKPGIARLGGRYIHALTLREAERLAEEGVLKPTEREKLYAGCEAIRRGISMVRIGSPLALLRERATVIVPDPAMPIAVDARLPKDDAEGADEPEKDQDPDGGPDEEPQRQPLRFPGADETERIRALSRRLARRRDDWRISLRERPDAGCEIGPRRASPFERSFADRRHPAVQPRHRRLRAHAAA